MKTLHVGRPNIGSRESILERLHDMLDRKWLTNNGLYVREFEERVADFVGVKHCVAVCNGTVGLQIAARAAGLSTCEVIVPSFTHPATPHALSWLGITPVFCDVNETHNIDPDQVSGLITPRTGGILATHLWGRPCDIKGLTDIAGWHELTLLFDAAHAFGCSYKGEMIGGFGQAEVFSFHATKFINSFEGGAIVTNCDVLADNARKIRNFGYGAYGIEQVGTNGKMSEIHAAMGLTSLEAMSDFGLVNYRNYKEYQRQLNAYKFVTYDESERNNYQYIVLEINNRDRILKALQDNNILARDYFSPGCHRMKPYLSGPLPETERLADCILVLPTGTDIGAEEITTICKIITEAA